MIKILGPIFAFFYKKDELCFVQKVIFVFVFFLF